MTEQEEFLFDGNQLGPTSFFPEREVAIRKLEKKFGLILNRRVRLTLRDVPREFEGKIILDQLIPPESRKDELILRIGSVTFDWRDIESCVLLGENQSG